MDESLDFVRLLVQKLEDERKIADNTLKAKKTSRDMFCDLVLNIQESGGGCITRDVLDAAKGLLVPSMISSRFLSVVSSMCILELASISPTPYSNMISRSKLISYTM